MARFTLLDDVTSGANAAVQTGAGKLDDLTSYDGLWVQMLPSGAAAAATITFWDKISGNQAAQVATPAGAITSYYSWALGATTANGLFALAGVVPPALLTIALSALGVGITGRLRVFGVKNGW